ncbi:hypothetical protein BB561_000886 [Smittium simulii]|uniref:Uncharacterized protein n=1 Tax=Smittium simulii TaxID=133385 RepID=A0A2T9YX49_9FUNG|nr:hypothetical protein BB561_000886 [Smittium simulii]
MNYSNNVDKQTAPLSTSFMGVKDVEGLGQWVPVIPAKTATPIPVNSNPTEIIQKASLVDEDDLEDAPGFKLDEKKISSLSQDFSGSVMSQSGDKTNTNVATFKKRKKPINSSNKSSKLKSSS